MPDNVCPGGALNLVGVIIGPRGNTQKRLQEQTGCVIVVRGKDVAKIPTGQPEDEEPPHVFIKGPDEASIQKAKKLVETLVDFNSPEGEKMRPATRSCSRRKGCRWRAGPAPG